MIIIEIKADSRYPIDRGKIRCQVERQLKRAGIEEAEVSIAIVGDRKMASLSHQFLGEKRVHPVLSFPIENTSGEGGMGFVSPPQACLQLGDIVISYPQALKWAAKESILVDGVIEDLVMHGVKHLIGMQ